MSRGEKSCNLYMIWLYLQFNANKHKFIYKMMLKIILTSSFYRLKKNENVVSAKMCSSVYWQNILNYFCVRISLKCLNQIKNVKKIIIVIITFKSSNATQTFSFFTSPVGMAEWS